MIKTTKKELNSLSKKELVDFLIKKGCDRKTAESFTKEELVNLLWEAVQSTNKEEEKNMNKTTTTTKENTAAATKETKKEETRPAITADTSKYLQSNSLPIDAEVFDKFAPLLTDDLKIRRWACNKNLYTFYLGRGQVAEITFRRKDFRVACRPAYSPEHYQARKSGYGLDAYTDEAELTAAVAEVNGLLDFYRQVEADKKAEKEKKAAEKKAAAEAKKKAAAAKKAEKEATKKAANKKAADK